MDDRRTRIQERLRETLRRFEANYNELAGVSIAPNIDYSKSGIERLFEELIRARAEVDRAAHILAEMRRDRTRARALNESDKELHQQVADTTVVSQTREVDNRLSWEERASWVRVAMVDDTIARNRCERTSMQIEGLFEACEGLVRSLERARIDLAAATDVLKLANTIGEVAASDHS